MNQSPCLMPIDRRHSAVVSYLNTFPARDKLAAEFLRTLRPTFDTHCLDDDHADGCVVQYMFYADQSNSDVMYVPADDTASLCVPLVLRVRLVESHSRLGKSDAPISRKMALAVEFFDPGKVSVGEVIYRFTQLRLLRSQIANRVGSDIRGPLPPQHGGVGFACGVIESPQSPGMRFTRHHLAMLASQGVYVFVLGGECFDAHYNAEVHDAARGDVDLPPELLRL